MRRRVWRWGWWCCCSGKRTRSTRTRGASLRASMGFEFYLDYSFLIPLLPLVGAIVSGFFGARWLKGHSHWPIWIGVGASAFLSIGLLLATINDAHGSSPMVGQGEHWFNWINAGRFSAEAGAWIDPLTAVMLSVGCGIGVLIFVFAAGGI